MRVFRFIISVVITIALLLTGCGVSEQESQQATQSAAKATETSMQTLKPNGSVTDELIEPESPNEWLFEAEDANLIGLERFSKDDATGVVCISGSGYAGLFQEENSWLVFDVNVPADGMYQLWFWTAANGSESYNTIAVNGRTFYDALYTKSGEFEPSGIKAQLIKGANTVAIEKSWGGIYVDCLWVEKSEGISPSVYVTNGTLVNEKASKNTKRLMRYLADQYGKATISGQYHYNAGVDSLEFSEIYGLTGKYPAIMGFDFMDYSPSRVEYGAQTKQTEYAVEWSHMGGIVSIVWHWNAPKDLLDTQEQPWWRGFYTEATTFDLDAALSDENSLGYELILRDIDAIAEQLKILAAEDIPVLWRPLHEASGGWFWWGAYGEENFKTLWKLMYERLTQTHGLNNLIWVYNGQHADWYPGDDFVDIIGEDVYTRPHDTESQYTLFEQALQYSDTNKIIALSEIGVLPSVDLMYADNARWSFFITWNGDVIVDREEERLSDLYNEPEHLIEVYQHEKIITLDELPWVVNAE